jgi:hypothetical protein
MGLGRISGEDGGRCYQDFPRSESDAKDDLGSNGRYRVSTNLVRDMPFWTIQEHEKRMGYGPGGQLLIS